MDKNAYQQVSIYPAYTLLIGFGNYYCDRKIKHQNHSDISECMITTINRPLYDNALIRYNKRCEGIGIEPSLQLHQKLGQ